MAKEKGQKIHYPFWYGGAASMIAACVTHPLDLAKVRLQTAHERGATLFGTLYSVLRHEGVFALYSGISASLLRQATYSTTRFGVYEYLKESYSATYTTKGAQPPGYILLPMSMFSGFVGGFVGNPADVINIRMQNDKVLPLEERRNYKHALDGIVKIVKNEGAKTLLRGVWPNATRGVLMTASQVVSYDEFKTCLTKRFSMDPEKKLTHFSASLLAGLVATTVCSPVDVVKTRIMHAPSSHGKQSAVGTLVGAVKKEGILFAFRGWLPAFIRLGPQTIVTFLVLEQLRHYHVGVKVTQA